MSQIEISCIGSDAVFTNTPNIFSGGNVDSVKFVFDNEWSGFTTKTAVFYTNPKETSLQILDSNNVATIPSEMLAQKGKLSIGVIGTNTTNDVKTSKILTYIVGQGAVTDDVETTSATPDIWLQLLSIVEHNKQIVDNMNLIVDESQMSNKANKDLSNVSIDDLHSKGVARMAFGTYVGTGTYGESNRTTLNFDFAPKLLIVGSNPTSVMMVISYYDVNIGYDVHNSSGGFLFTNMVWGENSVSWYSKNASEQANVSGNTYTYICIG